MAIEITKFVPSPLRDTIEWKKSKRANISALKANKAHYKEAFVSQSEIFCYYGPVLNGFRSAVYSDEELFVLGETIAKVVAAEAFVWIEKFELEINQIQTFQYALVCANQSNILVDQLSTDFDALVYDYLRLLPEVNERVVLCHNLSASERRKLAGALSVKEDSINILRSSSLDQISETDLTLPKALEFSEAMRAIDLVDSINQIVFWGLIGSIIGVILFFQIDSFFSDEQNISTVNIEVLQPKVIQLNDLDVIQPTTAIRSILLSIFPLIDKNLYVMKQFVWNGGTSYELTVDVDAKLAGRAKNTLEDLGYNIVSELGTGQWEGTASYVLETPFVLASSRIGEFNRRSFKSNNPAIDFILRDLEQLTGREWINTVAEYLDGEVQASNTDNQVAVHEGRDVTKYTYNLRIRDLDVRALEDLAVVLESREISVVKIELDFDLAKGVFHTAITLDLYDYSI